VQEGLQAADAQRELVRVRGGAQGLPLVDDQPVGEALEEVPQRAARAVLVVGLRAPLQHQQVHQAVRAEQRGVQLAQRQEGGLAPEPLAQVAVLEARHALLGGLQDVLRQARGGHRDHPPRRR
jgi:hypothetical protein